MIEVKITSWIFLAIAIATQKIPADNATILNVADYLNHSSPSKEEFEMSLDWLKNNDLLKEDENYYSLTKKGQVLYHEASKDHSELLKIWEKLEADFLSII